MDNHYIYNEAIISKKNRTYLLKKHEKSGKNLLYFNKLTGKQFAINNKV